MKITVIGLGYVGSVTAAGLAASGHQVLGVDISQEKVRAYRRGLLPIYEPGLEELLRSGLRKGSLRLLHTDEVSERLGDAIIIATGTPPTETGAADLGQVLSAVRWAREMQPEGGLIVMKSTVPPGTGMRLLQTELRGTGFDYAANPEFLREGQAVEDWCHPDRTVIGARSQEAAALVKDMYHSLNAPFVTTDITSAEMIKYAANAFLATKISFINEIAVLCERVGASIDEVSRGIAMDPRIGPSFLRAGVGYGGSCFPKDVRALDQLALTNDHNFELLRAVITVNNRQCFLPLYSLRDCFGDLAGVPVAVLGLAFKPNTDDIREAPAIRLIQALAQEGAAVRAYDPRAAQAARKALPASVQVEEELAACVAGAQALVLMTEWPDIVGADWREIARCVKAPRFLFDGRNALEPQQMFSLGFQYRGVGRGLVRSARAYARVDAK